MTEKEKRKKEYMRNYQREWIKNRRKAFFEDKTCEKCGSGENLVLHHKNPEEKESHKIWSWSVERREKEIAKCVVWCDSCHREYHHDLLRKPLEHGTKLGYSKGCRCDECKSAQNESVKAWRMKKWGTTSSKPPKK